MNMNMCVPVCFVRAFIRRDKQPANTLNRSEWNTTIYNLLSAQFSSYSLDRLLDASIEIFHRISFHFAFFFHFQANETREWKKASGEISAESQKIFWPLPAITENKLCIFIILAPQSHRIDGFNIKNAFIYLFIYACAIMGCNHGGLCTVRTHNIL